MVSKVMTGRLLDATEVRGAQLRLISRRKCEAATTFPASAALSQATRRRKIRSADVPLIFANA